MITATNLTKTYGTTTAVDDLSFTVRPGVVTGFLGPNGAGKSTTMRMLLGLDAPTSGSALVDGRPLAEHRAPLSSIGALLDAGAIHPQRSARDHLRALAASNGIPTSRVDAVLDTVGLTEVAGRRGGGFSLGMGQRLGIASALLGDAPILMLDEPVNGLDPEGILWIRQLLQGLAREGRTIFVSSHLMSEMELMAEHFLIIGGGTLIADVTKAELRAMGAAEHVEVTSPEPSRLATLLEGDDVVIARAADQLEVSGRSALEIGRIAAQHSVVLESLIPARRSLEIFMSMTADAVQYRANAATTGPTDSATTPDSPAVLTAA